MNEWAEFFTEFFKMIWTMFTNVPVPFTNMTFAHLFLGLLGSWALIQFLKLVLGIDYGKDNGKDYKT